MIISNSRRFIFIHIPKCGGTTVSDFLGASLKPQDISLSMDPHGAWKPFLEMYQSKFNLFKHSTGAEIRAAVGGGFFDRYSVLTFSRNPFARAYSAFRFQQRADARHRPDTPRAKELQAMTFEDFLQSRYVQNRELLGARKQFEWVAGVADQVEVFRIDDAEQALAELAARFFPKRKAAIAPRRANASTEPDEWMTMSDAARDLVLELYKEDFEYFGYDTSIPVKS
jgi:hypothetical protein